ncbi:ATP-dependent 6-phosphofructokinase [Nakamurella flavida]|uniref:ATP-dependent 6-phosphofructokinase n=1 Tax=Nakamurella flavida TaxID=363630 RepID=A0A938YRK0_9ACTN|nr:ATP-dependent 6-phosphofructokinase [Nakamurella flavida]MBM9477923.1 ATP-dependent 6-phosphofructokinase [Nakamurella flavida]MDP9778362.1 6-phosphofructokinase 1 [Nakamurella flavida]
MPTLGDLQVRRLGECTHDSPLARYIGGRRTNEHYVDEDDRVLMDDTLSLLIAHGLPLDEVPSLEPGGPRRRLFFAPGATRVAVVTCGGLCPGLNDVLHGLVQELCNHYGVAQVTGFRHGFAGLVPALGHTPLTLTPAGVEKIHEQGGTILGSSRGAQDPEVMVDRLVELGIDILFVVGGDGSMRGASGIAGVLRARDLPIAVIGIPKTIDNDIPYIGQSFGFQTAFTEAARAITAARVEAQAAVNGVGLVRLMGRHSGFIACYAALANHDADFVLVPEVPFGLAGENGLLAALRRKVADRGHAVVVVAEGAGQSLVQAERAADASGNAGLGDIGRFLQRAITDDFAARDEELTLKYLDPGYQIRSIPASARFGVLRAAGPGRGARRYGRTHRHGGRPPAQPLRARPHRGGRRRAQRGRPRRRSVVVGARVHGAAAGVALTPSGSRPGDAERPAAASARTRRPGAGWCGEPDQLVGATGP